jgi:hypothetical protein
MKLSSAPCLLLVAVLFCGCKSIVPTHSQFSRFAGFDNFATFTCTTNGDGECVLLSPVIPAHIAWNQSIVSWNADAPAGTYVKVEACAIADGKPTKFYTMAEWSLDGKIFPRTSMKGQADDDGTVDSDTMILKHTADAAQLRVTLGGAGGAQARLKFVGIDFANTKTPVAVREPNRKAWGKIIPTPEHSQHGYPNEKGWCSPTSTSMVLSRWAEILHRPEMDLTVPQVAASVYDASFEGTGNWPFNTAFAGSFDGMRAYVTRLDDLREVEDWIVAGIPVVLSARWDWLQEGRPLDADGHLIVCIGFTKDGDVVINDPATRLDRGESVRHIYNRANVIHSWTKSHDVVYLVYPEGAKIPPNKYGHWQ